MFRRNLSIGKHVLKYFQNLRRFNFSMDLPTAFFRQPTPIGNLRSDLISHWLATDASYRYFYYKRNPPTIFRFCENISYRIFHEVKISLIAMQVLVHFGDSSARNNSVWKSCRWLTYLYCKPCYNLLY
jgi:hypothetical protein